MKRHHLKPLSLDELNRALTLVWRELKSFGLACEGLDACQVCLGVSSYAYGYQCFGDRTEGRRCGDIILPRISLSHWTDWIIRNQKTITLDVLRHEYGHAYADINQRRIESKRFEKAFDAPHDIWEKHVMEYDPNFHISEYAATSSGEDFAEVFMFFLKHKGRLPRKHDTKPIRRKWKFVDDLRKEPYATTNTLRGAVQYR